MTVLGLMVLRTLNKKKWEIFSHFFLFSTFILPQNGHFFKNKQGTQKDPREYVWGYRLDAPRQD